MYLHPPLRFLSFMVWFASLRFEGSGLLAEGASALFFTAEEARAHGSRLTPQQKRLRYLRLMDLFNRWVWGRMLLLPLHLVSTGRHW